MADDRNFTLKIITPDRVFYEEQVSMVELISKVPGDLNGIRYVTEGGGEKEQ